MAKLSRLSKLSFLAVAILVLHAFSIAQFNQSPSIQQFKEQSVSLWSTSLPSLPSLSNIIDGKRQANTTLVIVIGNIRCGEDAWESLYTNVLDNNNADLALMIGDTYPQHQNSSMFDRAKYTWRFQEYDDWADAIDLVNGPEWRTTLLPHVGNDGLLGGVKGKRSGGGLLMMVRWFLMQHLEEDKILAKYDKFVITRSDHYYQCPHDLTPLDTEQFLWIPYGESYGGYNDRHLVVGKNHIIPAIDLITPLVTKPESFTRSALTMNDNIEQFQTRIWHRKGILPKVRQFKRMMFICAAPFEKTRWRKMSSKKVPNLRHDDVFIKYPIEYRQATRFCNNATTANLVEYAERLPKLKIRKGILNVGKKKRREADTDADQHASSSSPLNKVSAGPDGDGDGDDDDDDAVGDSEDGDADGNEHDGEVAGGDDRDSSNDVAAANANNAGNDNSAGTVKTTTADANVDTNAGVDSDATGGDAETTVDGHDEGDNEETGANGVDGNSEAENDEHSASGDEMEADSAHNDDDEEANEGEADEDSKTPVSRIS